jgi:hypothetical protein
MALSGVFAVSGGLGALAADEQRTALEVVVNLLRPEDRECLGLVYFQGLSIDEAAKRAGVSRGAFDMRLMRARQTARRAARRLGGRGRLSAARATAVKTSNAAYARFGASCTCAPLLPSSFR